MKKTGVLIRLLALVMAFSLGGVSTGCFGKFALTRKIYTINEGMGSKFVQTIIFWVFIIIPVYEVASFLDFFILNLIEFWTGSNPMAVVEHQDGATRLVMHLERQGDATVATIERYQDGVLIDPLRLAGDEGILTPVTGAVQQISALPQTDGSVITVVRSADRATETVFLPAERESLAARLDTLVNQPQSFSLAAAGVPRG